jgi:hypothetical protein
VITDIDEEYPNPFKDDRSPGEDDAGEGNPVVYQHGSPVRIESLIPVATMDYCCADGKRALNLARFRHQMGLEVERGRAANPKPINSLHEGYSVILEELEEVWEEVKKRPGKRNLRLVRDELIQCATMCMRVAVDLGLMDESENGECVDDDGG